MDWGDGDAAELAEAATKLGGELEEETDGETEFGGEEQGEAAQVGGQLAEFGGDLAETKLGGELAEEPDREASPWESLHACR